MQNYREVAGYDTMKFVMFYATLLKVTLLNECFSRFLNCANDTKSCNASPLCPQI